MRHPLQAIATLALLCLPTAGAASGQPGPAHLQFGFCARDGLHAYPLSNEGEPLYGLLLHQFTIINAGRTPVQLTAMEFELLRDGQPVDRRRLAQPDLDAFAAVSRQIETIPLAKASFGLVCGEGRLVPSGVALTGRALEPRQAMLVANQTFAFGGARDSLRVRVQFRTGAGPMTEEATLPVSMAMTRTPFRFPVRGTWVVKSGPSFHTHHRWALPSEFALDLVRFGIDGRSHRGDGSRFTDYHAYGQPVLAAAGGRVVRVVNDRPESADLLMRRGEAITDFSRRIGPHVQALLQGGVDAVSGNHVIIDHGNGEYSFYGHLQPGSVGVSVGQSVRVGDSIARLGGSGNALVEPHLHFHICDGPTPLACTGLPATFEGIELPFVSFAPRPLQSGDIVIAQ